MHDDHVIHDAGDPGHGAELGEAAFCGVNAGHPLDLAVGDFDQAIVEFWKKKFNLSVDELTNDKSLAQEIRLKAEQAKKELSANESFSGEIRNRIVSISRKEFESIIEPFVNFQ